MWRRAGLYQKGVHSDDCSIFYMQTTKFNITFDRDNILKIIRTGFGQAVELAKA